MNCLYIVGIFVGICVGTLVGVGAFLVYNIWEGLR